MYMCECMCVHVCVWGGVLYGKSRHEVAKTADVLGQSFYPYLP